MSDEAIDGVQPDAGQGDDDQGGSQPYADYLARIPDEVQGTVEPVFADWNRHINGRLQEASEYRKSWEPYQQAGIQQHDPSTVQWALQFAQVAQNDPAAIQQWFDGYAQQHGLAAANAAVEEIQQVTADPASFDPYDPNTFQNMLSQALSPLQQKLDQYESRWAEQAERERVADNSRQLEDAFKSLEDRHGGEFNRQYVESLAWKYANDNTTPQQVVDAAWNEYQALVTQLSKQVIQSKPDASDAPESGGGINAAPVEQARGGKAARAQAESIARQMWRDMQAQNQ